MKKDSLLVWQSDLRPDIVVEAEPLSWNKAQVRVLRDGNPVVDRYGGRWTVGYLRQLSFFEDIILRRKHFINVLKEKVNLARERARQLVDADVARESGRKKMLVFVKHFKREQEEDEAF